MGQLKLYGMRASFDEIMAGAVKRRHEPQRIIGDLLTAEISEKQARSIKYQMTIAKLPLAKDLEDFAFDDTPITHHCDIIESMVVAPFVLCPCAKEVTLGRETELHKLMEKVVPRVTSDVID